MNVSLFITCLGDSYFPRAGIAAVKVLERLGCRVDFPAAQTCCGQPMFNNGFPDEARKLAERMIRVFDASEHIVTVSGSCAAMIRDYYPGLFEGDDQRQAAARAFAGKTFEFAEFLVNVLKVDLAALGCHWPGRVTYHYSCHLRGLGLTDEAIRLLRQIDGLAFTPLDNSEQCCGFGGTFATKYPDISGAMVRDKVAAIRASGATTVISSEPGCTMNIAGACRRERCDAGFKSLPEIIAEGLGLMERTGSAGDRIVTLPAADHPLHVHLPYDLSPRAAKAVRDIQLQQFVSGATRSKDVGRRAGFDATFGPRYDALRSLAGSIKQHTLDHLDWYLERFIDHATATGVQIHFAKDAAQANEICLDIALKNACRLCIKSKSMVTEETGLVPELEARGIETIETDLGEFIIQLDGDAPSHIVTPMIHKDRAAVGRAFTRELGVPYTEDAAQLTMIAREHLRRKYQAADLGISGANFLIADTGSIVLCTNEGNGRFCTGGPRIHIAVAGIEKLIPSPEHLGVLLKVLARSSTAQPLTCYTSIITGPRKPGEPDGPEQVHLILLDNGRTTILEEETRELLRCIRCGACLNACPVYRKIGGHAYGSVYSGPIGATITPLLKGLHNYPDLPHASSLCGACYEACPVKIDLPRQLIRLRERMVKARITGWRDRLIFQALGPVLRHSATYNLAARLQGTVLRILAESQDAPSEPDPFSSRAWISSAPGPLRAWTSQRDFPAPAASSFREWWESRAGGSP